MCVPDRKYDVMIVGEDSDDEKEHIIRRELEDQAYRIYRPSLGTSEYLFNPIHGMTKVHFFHTHLYMYKNIGRYRLSVNNTVKFLL